VVDVGAGECCVIKLPGKKNIIYDTGVGVRAMNAIEELIPHEEDIDLMVLSHTDADHIGAVDEICDVYSVKQIIHSSKSRNTQAWRDAEEAIDGEPGVDEWDLAEKPIEPGHVIDVGSPGVKVTLVCGFNEPPADWDVDNESERNNAGSIVLRIEYKTKSILFCGDAVGRHNGAAENQCIAAEKFMCDNTAVRIASDVLVAPHHGADNGSSTRFIQAVDPTYVVFPAGHKHEHPRKAAAERYLEHAPSLKRILRTDFNDDEGGKEWKWARKKNNSDPIADDDVDIQISRPARFRCDTGLRTLSQSRSQVAR
jgi:competence protein ComEC